LLVLYLLKYKYVVEQYHGHRSLIMGFGFNFTKFEWEAIKTPKFDWQQ
jgi:hypothetical protein